MALARVRPSRSSWRGFLLLQLLGAGAQFIPVSGIPFANLVVLRQSKSKRDEAILIKKKKRSDASLKTLAFAINTGSDTSYLCVSYLSGPDIRWHGYNDNIWIAIFNHLTQEFLFFLSLI